MVGPVNTAENEEYSELNYKLNHEIKSLKSYISVGIITLTDLKPKCYKEDYNIIH